MTLKEKRKGVGLTLTERYIVRMLIESTPLNLSELLANLVVPEDNSKPEAQRIFHGRGHAYNHLNHITIDWLQPLILITLFAPINQNDSTQLVNELLDRFDECKSIQVQHRYQANWLVECIYGKPITQLEVIENGLRYSLEIKTGINTGLFLDMRNGRKWVQDNSNNSKVLNLFSYTCGFSIAAAAGGAESVFNIDISRPFLNTGRKNHRINHHDLKKIRFEKLNILKSFGRINRQGPYDLIICDPPTYQKGSIDLVRDYPKLIRRFQEFSSEKSTLLLCINTPHIGSLTGKEFLLNTIKDNAPQISFIDEITAPEVYKETQGKGTKALLFRV